MRKLFITALCLAILLPAFGQESGIRFFNGEWEEALTLAQKEKKKIFIDFYTEWCGPCLIMAQEVFPLPEVGEIYNKEFICLKIDAEKGFGKELAKRYGVRSYPTYVFVNPKNQELIHRSGGNKAAKDFMADAEGALHPKLSSIYLNQKYESGKYDAEFLIDYIRYQKRSGNSSVEKDFEKLLNLGKKLTDPDVWNLFRDCITGFRNPYLREVSENYMQFVQLFGKKEVDHKLASATTYAPSTLLNQLVDFEGKAYNLKMAKMDELFREEDQGKAWDYVDELLADTSIDQHKFVDRLAFYARINPKYNDQDLSFEELLRKIRYTRYVAYNAYDRDNAYNHYNYAIALEYVIKRAVQEGKELPKELFDTPERGKQEYNMRHPLLKEKPKRKK